MLNTITGQTQNHGAGMRFAVAPGSTKTFSIPSNPSATGFLCSCAIICSSIRSSCQDSSDYTFCGTLLYRQECLDMSGSVLGLVLAAGWIAAGSAQVIAPGQGVSMGHLHLNSSDPDA